MTILNTILSAGAVIASRASSSSGLFLDGSKSEFSLKSCTANEVVITGLNANALKPGQILAYIEGHKEVEYTSSICTSCGPLFRKIIDVDDNTFTTAYASFAEVFPEEVYDASLADVLIEPQLDCEHINWGFQRILQSDSSDYSNSTNSADSPSYNETEPPTETPVEEGEDSGDDPCRSLAIAIAVLLGIGCIIPPLSLILLPAVAAMGYLTAGTGACGYNGEGFNPPTPAPTPEPTFDPTFNATFNATSDPTSDATMSRKLEEVPNDEFPSTCSEWKAKDTNGNCLFVDCNIGLSTDPSACFSSDFPQVNFNDMIGVPDTILDKFDFGEATCSRNYCYASTFDKETCDRSYYTTTRASCLFQSVGAPNVIESSFPLEMSVLNQNCQIMSVLLYLSLKLFGREAYDYSQAKQLEYKHATCDQDIRMPF